MGTRFCSYRGMWVDERFTAEAAVTSVKFGSEAYFRLIEKHPELVEALKHYGKGKETPEVLKLITGKTVAQLDVDFRK